MRLLTTSLFLGAAFRLCEAGVLGFRQAQPQSCPQSIWAYVTVTVSATATVTVEHTPAIVTIIQQDPSANISTMGYLDSLQISQLVELAPTQEPWTKGTTFTVPIVVSGYEATEITNAPGGSVFYMSEPQTGTPATVVIGTLTDTVIPSPLTTPHVQNAQANNTSITSPSSIPFSTPVVPHGGWNRSTSTGSSIFGPATAANGSAPAGTGRPFSFGPFTSATDVQSTATQSAGPSTVTEYSTVYTTETSDGGYGATTAYTSGYDVPVSADLEKRQTCVWISAPIGGQEVGWCNNWAGGSILTYTTWTTTIYPTYIPGIGSIPPHQTSSTISTTLTSSVLRAPTSSSPPAPTATECGGTGPFQIGFDDLIPNTSDDNFTMAPQIQNPYDYFDWGNGWAYVPPPNEPFPPQSGHRLAAWDPVVYNATTITGSNNAADLPAGGIGALKNSSNHYWFSADSAYVGCDNEDPSQVCDFVATAFQWDNVTQSNQVAATQHFHITACVGFAQCQLTQINFNYLFYKMSELQFYAVLGGNINKFYIDSINMNWYNNTCEAGLARISGQE